VSEALARIRVWDLPTRIFHWALAALAVFSFTTGKIGGDWMAWHLRSGYAILALVLFRLAWGFAGSRTACFAHFVRGPRAVAGYARALLAGRPPKQVGHNPLGGWMIVLMLAAIGLQAVTGLFADDEIATRGPLAAEVSNAVVSRMSALHSANEWIIAALAALHVLAIVVYRVAWNAPLAGAMVHGWMDAPAGAEGPARRPAWLALVVLLLAALAVYALVEIYPMR
jgi:cytochrome b